jgi:hypothetical protein
MAAFLVKMIRMKSSDMEEEELCPKCKSDYLKPTDDPKKMICPFSGTSQLHLSQKDSVDCRGKPDS